jgi:long-subunit acyl-CoA synthetase (AMP-forming)
VRPTDWSLSYLPLSHIAEQVMSIHLPAVSGGTLSFCEDLNQLGDYLREVRPHLFLGVPRVWEKIQAKMTEAGAAAPPLRKKIAAWARKLGLENGYALQQGKPRPFLYPLANKIVYSKVRERLGLDRARYLATAAAPIAKSTLEFFLSLDMPILEIYGMSECTGPGTMSKPGAFRTATVGKIFPGTELKIAEDGEILMRGPHVFLGYLKDEEATRQTIDADGWLHSGDVGQFDGDAYLRITDRKKDLIITAGGKNVAPQNLEALLKGIPGVAQAVVVGDRRKYLVALLTLDPESARREAQAAGASGSTVAELAGDPKLVARIDEGVKKVNAGLASYESIKKFKILADEFTIESGELTPTMKVKRKVVNDRYKDAIESLYGGESDAAS